MKETPAHVVHTGKFGQRKRPFGQEWTFLTRRSCHADSLLALYFRYLDGGSPVCFLKTSLNDDFELKPESNSINKFLFSGEAFSINSLALVDEIWFLFKLVDSLGKVVGVV